MNPKKLIPLVLAIVLLVAPLMALNPVKAAPPMSVDVTNTFVTGGNINTTDPYHIAEIGNGTGIGATVTIAVHLLHANVGNAPLGVLGAEVHMDFSPLVTGGSPQFKLISVNDETANLFGAGALMGIPFSVYQSDGITKAPGPSFTGGVQIIFAGAGAGTPYNGEDVELFNLTFAVNGPLPNTLTFPTGNPVFPITITMGAFADPSANPIPCNVNNGAVQLQDLTFAFPAVPTVSIGPVTPNTGALTIGQPVSVPVTIVADPFWDIAGFDVNVTWDPALLAFSSYTIGNFLTMNGDPEFDFSYLYANNGGIEIVATKLSDIAPSGPSGTLFTLTLTNLNVSTVYPPPNTHIALAFTDLVSWAHPELNVAPWFGSLTAVDVPFSASPVAGQHGITTGSVVWTEGFLPQGANIDLFTTGWAQVGDDYVSQPLGSPLAWTTPYNGQGKNVESDSFAPQMLVYLYANVTYAQDRVSNKLVSFQINNALGQKVTILQNYTDINGIASVQYRIPMSDFLIGGNGTGTWDPAIFGDWNVIATVEVDQVIINDTMSIPVGWLVQVMSVTSNSPQYLKYAGLPMNFTVDVMTIHEQPLKVLISVDTYDVEGYPIGEVSWWVTVTAGRDAITGLPIQTHYVYGPTSYTGTYYGWGATPYGPYQQIAHAGTYVTMGIPTWTRIGLATVVGYSTTDFPFGGGVPTGPQSNADGTTTSFNIALH